MKLLALMKSTLLLTPDMEVEAVFGLEAGYRRQRIARESRAAAAHRGIRKRKAHLAESRG